MGAVRLCQGLASEIEELRGRCRVSRGGTGREADGRRVSRGGTGREADGRRKDFDFDLEL